MKTIIRKQKWALFILLSMIFSCRGDLYYDSETGSSSDYDTGNAIEDTDENVGDHDDSDDYTWDSSTEIPITLNTSSATVSGNGATVSGSIITISSAGTYRISGELSDGQVFVDTEDEGMVRLILNNASISCSSNAPIYFNKAGKAMIVIADATTNTITDGTSYISDEEDANAAIFSKTNLSIYGDGTLTVKGNYNDGITSKDGLIISSGNISVSSADDGIRGKDYLVIKSGTININAGGDGIISDNEEDVGMGYINIDDGVLNITSGGDAIQAAKDVLINLGEINLTSGGGSNKSINASVSAKGIKSGVYTTIYDGSITVNSADDAIHAGGNIEIYGGTLNLASGDDGIHADYDLEITGGDINITKSYEGLESYIGNININDGNIHIVASDDGINIAAGGDTGGGPGGGGKSASASGQYVLNIAGGYLVVNAQGDGLDSNDQLTISGGTQLVNGPTGNGNGALDYNGTCVVSGGFLIAVGSSGMSEAPGSSSSQYSFLIDFRSKISAGTILHAQDSEGNEVLTFKTIKDCQSIVFSSSELKKGTSYELFVGGNSSGTIKDGLYTGGTYSGGTQYGNFTISSMVTKMNL